MSENKELNHTNALELFKQAQLTASIHPRPALQTPFVAPRNPLEQAITHAWEQVLSITEIGIHDDFFELNGHSLLAMLLVSQLRAAFQVELSLQSLFEIPTIAGMATAVEALLLAKVEAIDESDVESLL